MASQVTSMMRAAVMHEIGGPEVLKVIQWPIPKPKAGEVLIRVKAAGLNRSEMYTRQGHSPGVKFPRVLGIEAVGRVEESPGGEFAKGDTVATAMGGMGRMFDGGYAEFTCVPAHQVQLIRHPELGWEKLGALPELMNTAWGSLFTSLRLQSDDHLLIRGGTSSVGLAAAAIAKNYCAYVAVTTRKVEREGMLKANGAKEVFIDNGIIAEKVNAKHPQKFSKILELVGVTTLADSMKCASHQGTVCLAGITGGKWIIEDFYPNAIIPSSVCLTTFSSEDFMKTPLDEIAEKVLNKSIVFPIKTFSLDQIAEAHQAMEESTAMAKIVILM